MSGRRLLSWLTQRGATWLLPVVVIFAWEGAARLALIPPRILPAPSQVALAFWESARNGSLFYHVAISAQRALIGLLIGGSIGFALGVINGIW
jgi:sulfonate transport system permease protein